MGTTDFSIKNDDTPKFGTWVDAESKKPPRLECFGEYWHSEKVLITDGKRQCRVFSDMGGGRRKTSLRADLV